MRAYLRTKFLASCVLSVIAALPAAANIIPVTGSYSGISGAPGNGTFNSSNNRYEGNNGTPAYVTSAAPGSVPVRANRP